MRRRSCLLEPRGVAWDDDVQAQSQAFQSLVETSITCAKSTTTQAQSTCHRHEMRLNGTTQEIASVPKDCSAVRVRAFAKKNPSDPDVVDYQKYAAEAAPRSNGGSSFVLLFMRPVSQWQALVSLSGVMVVAHSYLSPIGEFDEPDTAEVLKDSTSAYRTAPNVLDVDARALEAKRVLGDRERVLVEEVAKQRLNLGVSRSAPSLNTTAHSSEILHA